ncbi:MAG: hypothetical protein JWR37_1803 [Mycobacterium sp.]|jgi:hypothetical protein|nr:hypothetical protein [Mycobacterium sp.]
MSSNPGEHLSEEPQEERGARGSRDTGSDEPSGGPVDRPAGAIDDPSVPAYSDPDQPAAYGGTGEGLPQDVKPPIPPYEGRKTSADTDEGSGGGDDVRTGGATHPVTDPEYKSPKPGDTPGGATASPAEEQPASEGEETGRHAQGVGPAHTPGTGRAEHKL